MKLLVSGCSFSAGHGFPLGINDPNNWTNILSKKLNTTLTNVSLSGHDNPGIFLNFIKELTATDYDLALIQITALNRVILSPTIYGFTKISEYGNNYKDQISDSDYQKFHQVFVRLNQDPEHWRRLMLIIETVQNLVKQGYNIKFVNGFLDWDQEFFQSNNSQFAKRTINAEMLSDNEIEFGLQRINQDKQQIDLNLWINPVNSFHKCRVDTISDTDTHPGPKSQLLYADMILKSLSL